MPNQVPPTHSARLILLRTSTCSQLSHPAVSILSSMTQRLSDKSALSRLGKAFVGTVQRGLRLCIISMMRLILFLKTESTGILESRIRSSSSFVVVTKKTSAMRKCMQPQFVIICSWLAESHKGMQSFCAA